MGRPRVIPGGALLLCLLLGAVNLSATVIAGTVKDSSGRVVPGARIEFSGGDLPAPLTVNADAQGHFASPDVKPGAYTLKVAANGFESSTQTLNVSTTNQDLAISLQLATLHQEVTV